MARIHIASFANGSIRSRTRCISSTANIWFDSTNYIPGKTIEVLVDPNNPRRYDVETAFLPKVV